MSLWSQIVNVLRGDRLNREIDEELASHIEEAIVQGRDPTEARRAFGSALRQREESRDIRLIAWLDSLRADAVFGWRQLMKKKVTSAAAILSLALAIGAALIAIAFVAGGRVADTREGLIAEVVVLLAGLVGVGLVLYAWISGARPRPVRALPRARLPGPSRTRVPSATS